MTTINPKINVYQPSMQAMGQSHLQPNAPAMEGNFVQDNPMLNTLNEMMFDERFNAKDKKLTLVLFAPIWFGLKMLHKYLPGLHSGEYDKSLAGRLANWGDKVSSGRLAQSGFGKAVSSAGNWVSTVTKKIVNKSKVLTAITKMPTIPENTQVISMMGGAKEELLRDFSSLVKGGLGDTKTVAGKKEFLENLSEKFGISYKQLKNIDKFAVLPKSEQRKTLQLVKDICSEMGKTGGEKATQYQQIGNQLKAMTESTSKLGRFLPKALNRGFFGLTVGGGIFMIMSAFALAKAIPTTMKAEKGDKFSTFMEEFLSNISWVITFPIGIKLMNAIGGLKNLGMSPKTLAKYRQMLKLHNGTAFASNELSNASKEALKAVRNSGKVGFFGKILRGVGKFIGAGREVVRPYLKRGNNLSTMDKVSNFFAKAKFKGANWIAYPIGLLTYMLVFSPIVEKLFVKGSHIVFGKPKHSRYDEKPETPQDVPEQPVQPGANPFANEPINHQSSTNLINMHQNGQQYTNNQSETVNVNGDNYTYIPSSDGVRVTGEQFTEPRRTYIPSPEGVKLQPVDTTLADQAIARADIAERNAAEVLKMRF